MYYVLSKYTRLNLLFHSIKTLLKELKWYCWGDYLVFLRMVIGTVLSLIARQPGASLEPCSTNYGFIIICLALHVEQNCHPDFSTYA